MFKNYTCIRYYAIDTENVVLAPFGDSNGHFSSFAAQGDFKMSGGQAWLGYVCLLVAAACFGSNFVPVKHTPTGKRR
jgi:hypothetical protein